MRERHGVGRPSPIDLDEHAPVAERIAILRSALDELEPELAVGCTRVPTSERGSPSGVTPASASRGRAARTR